MTTDSSTEPMTPGWRTMGLVTVFYLLSLVAATWPAFTTFGTELPSRVDPMAHIWTMRWNKACLLQGRLPFLCPEIQYPVGASLGTLPPMHFQTMLYVPLSIVFDNDPLCYNLIRTFSFLLTGVGTFLLTWTLVKDRLASTLAGLMAMIGGPMMFFSHAELEQITVGWFPIFLIAWTRWVDRPSLKGLAASVLLYLLVAMSAPYYGVFAVFPASLYVAWRAIGSGGPGVGPWLKARLGWFASFASISGPVVILLFSNQIWALRHGYSLVRPETEFAMCRAPAWGYLVPPPQHLLAKLLPFSTNVMTEMGSIPSYLGVVTLAMIAYAAATRTRFRQGRYWWTVLAMLVVLSLGAHAWVGSWDVSLPAAWLKKYFIGFRMIRVPARFNLFAAVIASVVAGAGAAQLLARMPGNRSRFAVFGVLAALTVVDLAQTPYQTSTIPSMPRAYGVILAKDPAATFVDVPQFNSGAFQLPSACAYWQSLHGGITSAGYTAFNNARHDEVVAFNSPFDAFKLREPWYLTNPEAETFELARKMDFKSYAWLYLTVHKLRYVVVHHRPEAFPEFTVHLDRLEGLLAEAKVFEDRDTAVFDRELLPKPTRPVMLHTEGWGNRAIKFGRMVRMARDSGVVYVYNPTPGRPLTLTMDVHAHRSAREVALKQSDLDLARWQVEPGVGSMLASPPFWLPEGLSVLKVVSEGSKRLDPADDAMVDGISPPFSLWVTAIGLETATPEAVAGRSMGGLVR